MQRKIGRPLKIRDTKHLNRLLSDYFTTCKYPTVSGLAKYLQINDSTLRRYSKRKEFCTSIYRAKLLIEASYESLLFTGTPSQVRAAIFVLKNNFGWK